MLISQTVAALTKIGVPTARIAVRAAGVRAGSSASHHSSACVSNRKLTGPLLGKRLRGPLADHRNLGRSGPGHANTLVYGAPPPPDTARVWRAASLHGR